MKKTLYLHIGSPKTGTTAIQSSLFINRKVLEDNGLFLANKGCYSDYLIRKVSEHGFSKFAQINLSMIFDEYMRRFSISGCNSIMISAERCFPASPIYNYAHLKKWIRNHFNEFDIKIICYLRRQDFYVESFFNQSVKMDSYDRDNRTYWNARINRDIIDIDNSMACSFIQKDNLAPFDYSLINIFPFTDYVKIISDWAEEVGKENIIVRPYEKEQLSNGLLYDFYSNSLNFSDNDISKLKPIGLINESLSRDAIEFKLASRIYDTHLFQCIDELSDYRNTNQKYFTNEERKRFLTYHEEGNSFLAREYLGRKDGKLFYDEVEEYEPYPGLSVEKAICIRKKMIALLRYAGKYVQSDDDDSADLRSVEGIAKSARDIYFKYAGANCVKAKVKALLDTLACEDKTVVIYGVFGQLAEWVFEAAHLYERSMRLYVADKRLESKFEVSISNVKFVVADIKTIERLQPDAIIIAAAISGMEIRKELEELNLTESTIYPAYDFADNIWDVY